jgi:hypothetical protein
VTAAIDAARGPLAALTLLAAVVGPTIGCRKIALQDSAPRLDEPAAQLGTEALEDASMAGKGPRELPARCPKGGSPIPFYSGDARPQTEIEIGGSLGYEAGYAVGFAIRAGAARTAAVALFGPEATGPARVVELGPVAEDAPAPLLAHRSGDVLATVFGVPSGHARVDRNRELTVYAVGSDRASAVASFVKAADDSMASDIASEGRDAFVVWDEVLPAVAGAAPTGMARGVIRGAPVSPHEPPVAARDLSPSDSDAESPRIVADGAGYSVLWIARGPGDLSPGDASEVTGEPRAFGWLQRVEIDGFGAARGPVRDLTPRSGHISAYDARMFSGGAGLVIVARDDGEPTDGSGGALLRVRARGGAIDPVETIEAGGVGRGAPAFVEGAPPWLSWVGHDEQLRLLPLDGAGSAGGLASVEAALNEARPLAAWSAPSGAPARWLMATPTDPSGPLRAVECALAGGP